MDYSKAIDRLIARQLRDWDVAERNYAALGRVSVRTLSLDGCAVVLQHNPERRRSVTARVDKRSLASRKCFLCAANQPARQRAILWGDHYKIQVNPYPIFKRHLTIADMQHVPQRLSGRVGDMVRLAHDMPGFVVLYNGPQCGASAPDHAHFQAAGKGEMPLCDEVLHATTHLLADSDEGFIGYVNSLCRSLFIIETNTVRAAERYTLRLLDLLPAPGAGMEPLVNLLCCWDGTDHVWRIIVFPRSKHRPSCYGEREGQLLLSPASAEMGGVWAIPTEKDYNNLTANQVQALYDELCLSRDELEPILKGYSQRWDNTLPL